MTKPKEINDRFNAFIVTVTDKLNENLPPLDPNSRLPRNVPSDSNFSIPDITEEFVLKEINVMLMEKSTGLDGISVRTLNI